MDQLKQKYTSATRRTDNWQKCQLHLVASLRIFPNLRPAVPACGNSLRCRFGEWRHRQVLTSMRAEETMNKLQHIGTYLLICTFGFLSQPFLALSQTPPANSAPQHAGVEPDGQHDFDF